MSTDIRPEISPKSKWFIERERYYELKHFCMQYPQWKKNYLYLSTSLRSCGCAEVVQNEPGNPTETAALLLLDYSSKIDMVESAAVRSDEQLAPYILMAVTHGVSYAYLSVKLQMPASKDMFYDRYRKFFYILSKARK